MHASTLLQEILLFGNILLDAVCACSGYCYQEQPPWSAYRESSFGHGEAISLPLFQQPLLICAERCCVDSLCAVRPYLALYIWLGPHANKM